MAKQPNPPPAAAPLDPASDIPAPPITVDMLQSTEGHRLSLRLERLRKLSRRDADVAWLLDQYHGCKKALKP